MCSIPGNKMNFEVRSVVIVKSLDSGDHEIIDGIYSFEYSRDEFKKSPMSNFHIKTAVDKLITKMDIRKFPLENRTNEFQITVKPVVNSYVYDLYCGCHRMCETNFVIVSTN